MSAFEALFGSQLISKTGSVPTSEALAGKKHVMIYFSAHWYSPLPSGKPFDFACVIVLGGVVDILLRRRCPPCRGFTPVLAEKFKASAEAKGIAVVFASSDRDQKAFDEYYGEMPWLAVPFNAREVKENLGDKYGVRGIPCLVVLDSNGELVTKEGRGQIDTYFG
jgi:nucleoredoxin